MMYHLPTLQAALRRPDKSVCTLQDQPAAGQGGCDNPQAFFVLYMFYGLCQFLSRDSAASTQAQA